MIPLSSEEEGLAEGFGEAAEEDDEVEDGGAEGFPVPQAGRRPTDATTKDRHTKEASDFPEDLLRNLGRTRVTDLAKRPCAFPIMPPAFPADRISPL